MLDRFKVPEDIAVHVSADSMRRTVEAMFRKLGMNEQHAEQAADVLIYADLRGIDSHGVSNMMKAYIAGFEEGRINPTPDLKIVKDTGPVLNIDCDKGLGLAIGPGIMDIAIERAKTSGVAIAVAYNAGHYGAAAYHAHRALDHDMIGLSMTTGGVLVTPTHGAERLLGLNPIAIAAPAEQEVPYIFDASMSSLAGNKVRLLQRIGGDAAAGWVSGPDGAPIMEEGPVPEGFMMLPLGGTREIGSHKGFGLMLMVEVLTSLLAGTGGGPDRRTEYAHYFMAYDIAAFTDLARFKADMDVYLRKLRECAPAPGEERVVYPGMPEHEAEIERRREGIPYHPEVVDWFKATCSDMQLSQELDILN
jgi:LDH2 family malate/lactate/ureidoglycolate dehydrogenase